MNSRLACIPFLALVFAVGVCDVNGQETPAAPEERPAADPNQRLLELLQTTGKSIEEVTPEDQAIEATKLTREYQKDDRVADRYGGYKLVVSGIVIEKEEDQYSLILRGSVNDEGDETWVGVALGLPYKEIAPKIELGDRIIVAGTPEIFDRVSIDLWYGSVLKIDKENRDRSKIVPLSEQVVAADEIQPTMKQLLKACRGDTDLFESAMQRFASADMKNPDRLQMYSLENPVVRQKKQRDKATCYYVEFLDDLPGSNIFAKFCWQNDRLINVEFLTYR